MKRDKFFQAPAIFVAGAVLCLMAATSCGSKSTSTRNFTPDKEDSLFIDRIYALAMSAGEAHDNLRLLCAQAPSRLSGSPGAEKALEVMEQVMRKVELDAVFRQPVLVPVWIRGTREKGMVRSGTGSSWEAALTAIGNAEGTGKGPLEAQVVEVHSFDELQRLGRENLVGKIVFYNRPFDPAYFLTFKGYGEAVDQRVHGASQAAKYGAVGVLVRSMTPEVDDFPHTGSLRYNDSFPRIPAAALSTAAADRLSADLKRDPGLKFSLDLSCGNYPEVMSANLIGELQGRERPNEYLVVAGHLDAWDNGEGAHDDGSGCVQAVEALRLLKSLGYKPRHTLRAVMYMNEENGLRGGYAYRDSARARNEVHIAAMESDAGGFAPRGFSFKCAPDLLKKVQPWAAYFEPYQAHVFRAGYGGADIGPLEDQCPLLIGLVPEGQRYFDFHHTSRDVFEAVDNRELHAGAATMAALIYLLDKYGIPK